jgi:low affinity Fe/Cu permease
MISPYIGVVSEVLVAILLIATCMSCYALGQKIVAFKADETAMRSVIDELVGASDAAERAIMGLRSALSESHRHLGSKLEESDKANTLISAHIIKMSGLIQESEMLSAQVKEWALKGEKVCETLEHIVPQATHAYAQLTAIPVESEPLMLQNPEPQYTPTALTAEREEPSLTQQQALAAVQALIALERQKLTITAQPIEKRETSLKAPVVSAAQIHNFTAQSPVETADAKLAKAASIAQGLMDRAMKRLEAQAA